MSTPYGASRDEWEHFTMFLGLDADLLPVVSSPIAKISPNSKMKKTGKTPSRYNSKLEVIGFPEWTQKTATPEEIDEWQSNPDYGICLQTRRIRALDFDITDAEAAVNLMKGVFARVGKMPVRMRRNSSKFVIAFQLDGDYGKRVIKTKYGIIEFLATGQQFVAAGMHDSGVRYEWAGGLPEKFPVLTGEQFEALWKEIADTWAIEPPTEARTRNAKLNGDASKLMSDPVAKFLADSGHVKSIGHDGQIFIDCPFKADHTGDSGETETAYFCAGTRGYEQGHFKCLHAHCASHTNEDYLGAYGYGATDYEDVSTPNDKPIEKKKRARFKPIRADDYLNRPPVTWIIKGIVPAKSAGMTFGGSGDGKTFVVLDLACALALGLPWNGRKVKRGHVVYVCAEGSGGFMSRIQAYAKHHDISLKNLGDYLTIVPASPNFLKKEDVIELAKEIRALQPLTEMIVVDTLAQTTTGGDENSTKDMNVMLKHVELLRDLTGATSHLIHHLGKDESRGARGSTALKADCDFQFSVTRQGERRLFWVEKMKDGIDNFGWNFILVPVEIGVDEDGETITSCVVDFEEDKVEQKKPERESKRGSWEQCVLDTWETLGGGDMRIDDILDEAIRRLPLAPGDHKKTRDTLRRAMRVLQTEGELILDSNMVKVKIEVD